MKKLFILSIVGIYTCLFGCTGIFLKNNNDTYVYARTLEFGSDLNSKVLFVPHNIDFKALVPNGQPLGLQWKSKYAVVGINAFDKDVLIDGVNEKGLAGGLFYFPGFAKYQDVKEADYNKSLPMWTLLTWILTNFSTIEEIKQALPNIFVTNAVVPGAGSLGVDTPVHLIIHDMAGKSLVIEYENGKLNMFDNPLGVITNSPGFDWHLTNLRNYINLTPENARTKEIAGIKFKPLGEGSGMLGLPGDFTPPSRFVRAVALSQSSEVTETELDGVKQAFHILNNFDIPKYAVRNISGDGDFTRWTSVIDLKNKIFYFRTYENFQIHKIDLNKLDFEAKETRQFSMVYPENIVDVLDQNKPKTKQQIFLA